MKKRIEELVKILNEASKAYYQKDTEIMSNQEYDALYDELAALEKETGIVMAGYFVEIEGSDEITMDEDELSEALWISRDEMPPQTNPMSLTARMFEAFRLREVEF